MQLSSLADEPCPRCADLGFVSGLTVKCGVQGLSSECLPCRFAASAELACVLRLTKRVAFTVRAVGRGSVGEVASSSGLSA